jgi:hypothetical protein
LSSLPTYYLKLAPVIYKPDAKISFIKETIIGFTPEEFARREDIWYKSAASNFSSKSDMLEKARKMLRRRVFNYAAILKHESFFEEKEWRIITFDEYAGVFRGEPDINPRGRMLDVKFREGSNTLIPYLQLPLAFGEEPILFDEVVIGPTPHPKLSEYSLNLLLKPSNPNTIVVTSSTSYKNW